VSSWKLLSVGIAALAGPKHPGTVGA
jgi:hypothetical protein